LPLERAREILGPDFASATQGPGKYTEVAEQYHQNVALFSGNVEVVIADINIFRWYNRDPRVTADVDVSQKVSYHKIFPPTPYRMAFRDADVRNAFDRALAKLKSSGRYQELIDSYGGVIN
jgi:polar amino acid transport system substrate-binding protein